MAEKFRLAGNVREFFSDLKNLKGVESSLTIWQSSIHGKKILKGKFLSYEKDLDNLFINLELNKVESLNQESDVYMFSEKEGILFKGKYQFCVANKLKVLADEKFYLKEKRENNRFFFHYSKVDLKVSQKREDISNTQKVFLKDISNMGMAFLVTKSKQNSFHIGQRVYLESVSGIELPKPLPGVVKHITLNTKKLAQIDGKYFHIGVEFDKSSKLLEKVIITMGAQALESKQF